MRSEAGESIAEVLVGVLIVALATVLFSVMVNVAVNTSMTGVRQTEAAYGQLSSVDAVSAQAKASAGTVTVVAEGGGLNTSFGVQAVTAEADPDNGIPYTFTRYFMPEFALQEAS